jgi:hypothetical protein
VTGHVHQWRRYPVTDFTVTYQCDCGAAHKIQWANILPHVSGVDAKVTGAYGGTVLGDAHHAWEFTLSRRMLQVAELGLSLHIEELETDCEP